MSGHFHSEVGSSTRRTVVSIFLFFGVTLLKYFTGFFREFTDLVVVLFSVEVDEDVSVEEEEVVVAANVVVVKSTVSKVVYSSIEVSSLLIPTVIFVFTSSSLIMLLTRWNVVTKTTQKNALNL